MPKTKLTESQPKYELGWQSGESETFEAIFSFLAKIEADGFIVPFVDVEERSVNGTWVFGYVVRSGTPDLMALPFEKK